ncbi:MAG: sodium:alanine symporter family protein [Rhabdochlamydiaceae bacterium]|nr:sodium:alanine symporter family protein [Rhabdochlamydiaceae bacterium]
MDLFTHLSHVNHLFTLLIIFPAVIAIGFYLTLKLRFVQLTHLKKSFLCFTKNNSESDGNISRFRAVCSVLAGNLGTGNISGMAVAIATGGPGALVWMWVMVFFGSVIQFVSCVLGVSYRKKTESGEYVGGPMYYLERGLGLRKTGVLFAALAIFGAIAIGNLAQINSVVLPLQKLGLNPLYCSLGIAVALGLTVLGGIQRISNFASYIIPLKAFLYLGTALVILVMHYETIIPALKLMFHEAFDISAFIGGVAGTGMMKAITTGFDRGLFATDAGLGIVPILQASAKSEHPVVDGIASLLSPLIVMIVCSATGLVLIVTGAYLEPHLQSTNMVTHAFSQGLNHPIGGYIVIIALILFAFTTIMAWCYCGEKALNFIVGKEKAHLFRYFYIAMVPIGSLLKVDIIWILADVAVSLMLTINLIGIVGLSNRVIHSTKEYRSVQN